MLPTDLYHIIYSYADDFTKLRLHQVCSHFYKIKIADTELMRQIKFCMQRYNHISYATSIISGEFMLSASIDNYDIHRELIKLINLLNFEEHEDDDGDDHNSLLISGVLNTHGVNIVEFCHRLYLDNYHVELFRFFNLVSGKDIAVPVLRYFSSLSPNSMIQLLKSVNGKEYINSWGDILYYIYSHFDNYVEIISEMYKLYYSQLYDGEKNRHPPFLNQLIDLVIQRNISSFYTILFQEHMQTFIFVAIKTNSIPTMQYINSTGITITEQEIKMMLFYTEHLLGSYHIYNVYKYLGNRMDSHALSLFFQIAIQKDLKFVTAIIPSHLQRMNYHTFGICIQKNLYNQKLEFIECIYKNLINDTNCLLVVRGLVDSYEITSIFKPGMLRYIYNNSTEAMRSDIMSYINSIPQTVRRDNLLRALSK